MAPNILSVFRPRRYERAYARKKWAELSGAEKAIGGIGAILAVGGTILLARWVAGSDIGAVLDAYAAASQSEIPKILDACLSRVHDLRDALSGGSDTKRKTARAILRDLHERLQGSDGPCKDAQLQFLGEALSFSEPEPSEVPRRSLDETAAMGQRTEAARLKKRILARWALERIPSDMIFHELVRRHVLVPVHSLFGHICTWDVRKLSSMASAFAQKTLTLDLSFWDTRSVTDMSKTFDGLRGYVDVSTWDTRNVRNMEAMFRGASIKGDIGAWDVRNVRSMSEMFKGARFMDAQDLSKWDLRSIPSEEGRRDMFASCEGTITKPNFARFGASARGSPRATAPAVLRLILAQQAGEGGAVPFAQAYREIVGGSKRSHWIWYVWPTLRGVRKTGRPELELPSFECARAYLRDGTLRERLVSITSAAAAHLEHGVTQRVLFGAHWRSDAPKYRECCSLFLLAAQCENLASESFRRGLDACGGELSVAVVRVLREDAGFAACARSAPERAYV